MSISAAAHPERLHQPPGVLAGDRAGGEAGHRVAEHVRPRQAEAVHRAGGDDQRVGGVEAAGDADHELLDPGRPQTGLEPSNLDVVDLLAALGPADRVRGDVGESLDLPAQRDRLAAEARGERDPPEPPQRAAVIVGRVGEAARARTVGDHPIEVDVGEDHLLLLGEPVGLGDEVAVLADQRLAVPGDVGRRLALAGGGVHVPGDRPARVGHAQQAAVVGLPDGDVARREVRHDRRTGHRAVAARRDRGPHVLADLDVEGELHDVLAAEQQLRAERHLLAGDADP